MITTHLWKPSTIRAISALSAPPREISALLFYPRPSVEEDHLPVTGEENT
jgi:hypothetical protein